MKTVLDLVARDLDEAIESRKEALASGRVGSYEEYKYLSGIVAGLQGALQAIKDAQRQYIEE